MKMAKLKFLINTFTHWDEPPRARHQVANALAKNHLVIFVAANKVGFPRIKTFQVQENLKVVQPYLFVSNKIRYRLPVLNEIYQNWLYKRIAREYGEYRVINFDFTATRIYHFFKDVIFYYNDNFASISKRLNPSVIARYHQKKEAKVATRAKFCVSTTQVLMEKLLAFNPASYTIPLGGPNIKDYEIQVKNSSYHEGLIRVGLMGFISTFSLSTDILNIVLNQKNMELVFIGPVEDKLMGLLENRERLLLKGTLTGIELFQEINKFDVALAPYCEAFTNDKSIGVGTGSKTYQYMALGKPIVISNMAGLQAISQFDKFIYVAENEEEFPELINRAYRENTDAAISERVAFAIENTWEKRMEKLIEIYNNI